jgi:hypothetical protein
MARQSFDPVAFVLGLVFVVAGIIAVTGGSIVDDGGFLLPVGLIGLGVAVMVQARMRAGNAGDDEGLS